MESRVTTETNVNLTNEHKDKGITNKCIFLLNSGSVNCREFVEFEESDSCLYENMNYKYQYEKQTSESKIGLEYGDSDNSNIKIV